MLHPTHLIHDELNADLYVVDSKEAILPFQYAIGFPPDFPDKQLTDFSAAVTMLQEAVRAGVRTSMCLLMMSNASVPQYLPSADCSPAEWRLVRAITCMRV